MRGRGTRLFRPTEGGALSPVPSPSHAPREDPRAVEEVGDAGYVSPHTPSEPDLWSHDRFCEVADALPPPRAMLRDTSPPPQPSWKSRAGGVYIPVRTGLERE